MLSDPERYAGWVVGAKKTRTIDPEWPQPGSRFAHRQGAGPLHIEDVTMVRELDAPNRIVLEAKIRPLLTAHVTLTLDPLSRGTLVTMDEVPIGGPVSRLGRLLEGPLHVRNSRALRRLEGQLADSRSGQPVVIAASASAIGCRPRKGAQPSAEVYAP